MIRVATKEQVERRVDFLKQLYAGEITVNTLIHHHCNPTLFRGSFFGGVSSTDGILYRIIASPTPVENAMSLSTQQQVYLTCVFGRNILPDEVLVSSVHPVDSPFVINRLAALYNGNNGDTSWLGPDEIAAIKAHRMASVAILCKIVRSIESYCSFVSDVFFIYLREHLVRLINTVVMDWGNHQKQALSGDWEVAAKVPVRFSGKEAKYLNCNVDSTIQCFYDASTSIGTMLRKDLRKRVQLLGKRTGKYCKVSGKYNTDPDHGRTLYLLRERAKLEALKKRETKVKKTLSTQVGSRVQDLPDPFEFLHATVTPTFMGDSSSSSSGGRTERRSTSDISSSLVAPVRTWRTWSEDEMRRLERNITNESR